MELTRLSFFSGDGDPEFSTSIDDMVGGVPLTPVSHIIEVSLAIDQDETVKPKATSEIETEKEASCPKTMNPRAYQLEMLEESLHRNVIVAMDTGSGKTQVAVLRIKAELEKCLPDKIIWFLVPTVSLSEQQYDVIRLQNPSVPIKLLSGDLINSWSQEPWEIALRNTRIFVTTYQILLDALDHGFVNMERLALLVIDEAHHCTGKSPISKIMSKFYRRAKDANKSVPAILGLSASPIMRSNIQGVKRLEAALDAKCVTPTIHRDELLKCVNKPDLIHHGYKPIEFPESTTIMESLHEMYRNIDIKTDPTILRLARSKSEQGRELLREILIKRDTYTEQQMKGFWGRSKEVRNQLGPWAVDGYISKVIGLTLQREDATKIDQDTHIDEDKQYLADCFRKVSLSPKPSASAPLSEVSEKANILIKELLTAGENVVGIIFVKERATVTILKDLLEAVPAVVKKYRIGTMVGTSNFSARKRNVYELANKHGLAFLQDFRSGKINLLIATSVLEEGIDVPACNLVICFEKPANLKSFIQRRGRARMKKSKLVILYEESGTGITEWEALEEEMKREYQREREELARLEQLEGEDAGSLVFEVPATGARLDLDNAKAHLEHFCRVASRGEYVDSRPDYIFHRISEQETYLITAEVRLPPFLDPALRRWNSGSEWISQKNAVKDAAFHAYKGLYDAGMVNDNLLPIRDPQIKEPETTVVDPPYFNPWKIIAQAWESDGNKSMYPLDFVDEKGHSMGQYFIVLPVQIPQPRPIKLYPEWNIEWTIEIGAGKTISHGAAMKLPDHTSTLLAMHFGHRWEVKDRSLVIKVFSLDEIISRDHLGADMFDPNIHEVGMPYLVRNQNDSGTPYEYMGLLPSKPPVEEVQNPFFGYDQAPANVPYLIVRKVAKRADNLHRISDKPQRGPSDSKPYQWVLPMPWVGVDRIPKRHADFARMIPSVIHELEVLLTAVQLHEAVLRPIRITDMQLVIEAISSRNAVEPVNYERLEFLGDSILKFCTVVQVSAQHLMWSEGFLTFSKDQTVSNYNLWQACIKAGVPKFILTKIFTGLKWRPIFADEVPQEELQLRNSLPSKMPADVIEALIGASYLTGGIPKALECISTFLATGKGKHNVKWFRETEGRQMLFNYAAVDVELPPTLRPVEELIGYSFRKKALLVEAMTHASYSADMSGRSLERLEFIGDAILEYIIVTKVFNFTPPMPENKLHLLKTAMVNGDFLGFLVLQHGLRTVEPDVADDGTIEEKETFLPLWKFMRHATEAIGTEQIATSKRFESLREQIMEAFTKGSIYPWALLARLQPRKFYSDLLEALIGAVWIDSGSFEACEDLLKRFSMLEFLDHMLEDDVHIMNPREELSVLAASESFVYRHEIVESSDGDREYECTVEVGGRVIGHVEGALNKEEARTKAAELAVKLIKKERKEADEGRQT